MTDLKPCPFCGDGPTPEPERPFVMGANHGYETAMEQVAEEARRYAAMYPEASDGRNTFTLFAEWADRCANDPVVKPATAAIREAALREAAATVKAGDTVQNIQRRILALIDKR